MAQTTKKTAAKTDAAEAGKPAGYRVTVKTNGFRRAGRAWTGTTDVAADDLTLEQLADLMADPMFRVEPT